MQKSPPPFIWACPEENNILNCKLPLPQLLAELIDRAFYCRKLISLVITWVGADSKRGPPDTPYAGGEYHGLIWFPSDYRTPPRLPR
jgi:ubiquitin-conjugating enzyme E2 J2